MTAKQKANRERFKKVVAEAKKLRAKNPKLTQPQAVKQAWAIMYKGGKVGDVIVTYPSKKEAEYKMMRNHKGEFKGKQRIASPKFTKVTAKKGKKTSEMHTDTKSHNVNIRVVSGTGNYAQIIFTRYTKKYGKRVTKNTPLDIVVTGGSFKNVENFGSPINSNGTYIYKSKKEKFNFGNEKGELIRFLIPDDENYSKHKYTAKLSALSELF